jgi:sugar phosphate isomerase/epimerase
MDNGIHRRGFLKRSAALAALSAGTSVFPDFASAQVKRRPGTRITIGLNAYSFNRPLVAGKMTIDDVIDYCASQSIEAVDLTGYYFPGYPEVPKDEYIFSVKRKAFLNGVTISGTGVRNNFALVDPVSRKGHIELVKNWIEVAQKLGSDFVRVFSGPELAKGMTLEKTLEWMIPAFEECAEYGKMHGVIVGLQHHDDVLKTADETIRVVKAVNSDWFHVILDVGSLRQADPYEEIEKLVPYACSWQLKEHVWYGSKSVPIDLPRLKGIIDQGGSRGYLPIEALGRGEPTEVVTSFLNQVRKVFAS